MEYGAPMPSSAAVAPPAGNAVVAPPNKQLVYQATLNLAVFQVSKALDQVDALVRELGGYLVNRSDQAITIRVPNERFREALQKAVTFGNVPSQNISVQDVTDQFFDLQARIRNARAVRDRLAELLKKTTNIEEALSVERELRRIGDELEQMEGQLKRLSELFLTPRTIVLAEFGGRKDRFDAHAAGIVASLQTLSVRDWLRSSGPSARSRSSGVTSCCHGQRDEALRAAETRPARSCFAIHRPPSVRSPQARGGRCA